MHDEILKQILENIENDRTKSSELLELVHDYINGNVSNVERAGGSSAKYLEALQRSNEQLIKIFSIVVKEGGKTEELEFDEELKDRLFEEIKNGKEE